MSDCDFTLPKIFEVSLLIPGTLAACLTPVRVVPMIATPSRGRPGCVGGNGVDGAPGAPGASIPGADGAPGSDGARGGSGGGGIGSDCPETICNRCFYEP